MEESGEDRGFHSALCSQVANSSFSVYKLHTLSLSLRATSHKARSCIYTSRTGMLDNQYGAAPNAHALVYICNSGDQQELFLTLTLPELPLGCQLPDIV